MADNYHNNTTCTLDLTISIPPPASGGGGMRDLDINQVPILVSGEDQEEEEEEEDMSGAPPRKKLRLSKEQSRLLEESFRQHHTLNPRQKDELALQLKLKPRQVEVWFQNRRARSKLKQTELECEYLKRWFGSLTEQNRRLQREVEELRAMKVCPSTMMSPHSCEPLQASALTMCPQCERVTTISMDTTTPKGGAASRLGAAALSSDVGTHPLQGRSSSTACMLIN